MDENEIIEFEAGNPNEEPEMFLPEGEYWFRIADATSKRSASKGEPMIELKLQLYNIDNTEGPFCFDFVLITPKMKWKVDQFLACIGMHPGEGARIAINAKQYIGLPGYADFRIEEYKGRKNNKVKKFIVDPDEGEHSKNLPKAAPAFRPGPPPVRSAPPPAPTAPLPPAFPNGLDDDEIPF